MHASSSLWCSLLYPPMQSIIVTCHPPGSLCTHNAIHSLMASYKRKQGFSSFTYFAHVQLNACQTKHTHSFCSFIYSHIRKIPGMLLQAPMSSVSIHMSPTQRCLNRAEWIFTGWPLSVGENAGFRKGHLGLNCAWTLISLLAVLQTKTKQTFLCDSES